MNSIRVFKITIMFLIFASNAFAAHPLITDDTDTQGKGKSQVEINGEYGHDSENGVKTDTTELASILSYGIVNNADIILRIPYKSIRTRESGASTDESGFSDVYAELKWRFFEKDGLGLALKPGITIPTGDKDKGLGAGRMTYSLFFITTKEIEPWALHLNLGYLRNENGVEERKNLWHASLASTVEITKGFQVVANAGIERNSEKDSNTDPAFILLGLIYSISKNFDVDAGFKYGLTRPETDSTFLAGVTLRF